MNVWDLGKFKLKNFVSVKKNVGENPLQEKIAELRFRLLWLKQNAKDLQSTGESCDALVRGATQQGIDLDMDHMRHVAMTLNSKLLETRVKIEKVEAEIAKCLPETTKGES